MVTYSTPGVYIIETNASNETLTPVPTSVTLFIGYTEKAEYNGKSLFNTYQPISSLAEYELYFGKGPEASAQFSITPAVNELTAITLNGQKWVVSLQSPAFRLYHSLRLFFINGGTTSYVISVGDYNKVPALTDLSTALQVSQNETDINILVIPDAPALPEADHASLMQQSLSQCASLQNRVAILDVYNGGISDITQLETTIMQFRNSVGNIGLSYGAAYFPWLVTNSTDTNGISFTNFPANLPDFLENSAAVQKIAQLLPALLLAYTQNPEYVSVQQSVRDTNTLLLGASNQYQSLVSAALSILNTMPPAAAIAGVFASVDAKSSVAKAPAGITVAGAVSLTTLLNDSQQTMLNGNGNTVSVNALRVFPGRGLLVWGARTLGDPGNEFKYIHVRKNTNHDRTIR